MENKTNNTMWSDLVVTINGSPLIAKSFEYKEDELIRFKREGGKLIYGSFHNTPIAASNVPSWVTDLNIFKDVKKEIFDII